MADNVILSSGSGGATAAADDIGGVHHQRVKVSVGADGTANDAVPVSNGLDTTATGVLAAGLVAQVDDTATGTVTENQFGPVRMSTRRALLVEGVASGTVIPVSDGGGNLSIDDGGNSITVDGTVAVSGTVTVDGSAVTQPVSAASLPLPSGAATSAKQDTAQTALDAIKTAAELIDDAIKADDAAFTPATTKVMMAGFAFDDTTPDGVDEGDAGAARMSANRNVYVQLRDAAGNERGANVNASNQLSVSVDNTVTVASHAVTNAGTFAVQESGAALTALQLIDNLVLAEDAVHGSGDPGVQALAVRKDTGAALAGTDGDYSPLQVDASGALRVTGGGGGTEYTVNAAAPADPVGATFVMERDDQLAALTEIEGDWTNPRATSKGALWVALADASGDPITSFGGGTQYTEDAAAAADPTGTALIMVRKDTLAALTTTDGDNVAARGTDKGELYVKHVDAIPVTDNGSTLSVDDGAGSLTIDNAALSVTGGGVEASALRVTIANDSTGVLSVDDNGGSLTVDVGTALPAGTNNIGDVDVVTLPNVTLAAGTNTNEVVGDAAHDAAVAGNPLLMGVDGRQARATAVSADGDVVRLTADRYGRLQTRGVELSKAAAQATASGNTELVAAPSAGNKLRLHRVELSNSHATTALTVGVRFGAAGTIFSKAYLPAAGGAKVINLGEDYVLGADAEAFNVNLSAAGQVECTAFYEAVAT